MTVRISGGVLRTDKWIQSSLKTIEETIISSLVRLEKNPHTQDKKISFDFLYLKRKDGIHIKYPGPDGNEEVVKEYD